MSNGTWLALGAAALLAVARHAPGQGGPQDPRVRLAGLRVYDARGGPLQHYDWDAIETAVAHADQIGGSVREAIAGGAVVYEP